MGIFHLNTSSKLSQHASLCSHYYIGVFKKYNSCMQFGYVDHDEGVCKRINLVTGSNLVDMVSQSANVPGHLDIFTTPDAFFKNKSQNGPIMCGKPVMLITHLNCIISGTFSCKLTTSCNNIAYLGGSNRTIKINYYSSSNSKDHKFIFRVW